MSPNCKTACTIGRGVVCSSKVIRLWFHVKAPPSGSIHHLQQSFYSPSISCCFNIIFVHFLLAAKDVGEVAVLHRGKRYIYYLITKPKYFDKPTYKTLEDSLEAMKKHCVANGVTALSMPRIGCGLDKLEWPKVEECLNSVQ